MSTNKHIDRICVAALIISLILGTVFVSGAVSAESTGGRTLGYESRLFDTSRVHEIELVMDDWDEFIAGCESEEYSPCAAVIDGESFRNIGIRAKGNTSLSSVRSLGSQRYSFKLEFDKYDGTGSYHGLDKLCLNNLIQDNTMMKDYIVYTLMSDFGVASPLCSFVHITVNGEEWGLYLAVEGVEQSFLTRNYGADAGNLYKPDSMSFGGGRGNGKDFEPGQTGAQGSSDVKLRYTDDEPDSYQNIFDSAKTEITDSDKARLIASLKSLSEYTELESVLDTEEVLRYFVVHSFVVNGDSYTGSMIHNYYLHEYEGRLSMIPWDYNLAFGTFQGSAQSGVNELIDSPVSGGSIDDRPMVGWIFSDEEYTERYHSLYTEFLERWFGAGQLDTLIAETAQLIAPYVESDPTKFCTAEEFDTAVKTLRSFAALRAEAVSRQLEGNSEPVDASSVNSNAMGSMADTMGGRGNTEKPDSFGGEMPQGMEPPQGGFDPGSRGEQPFTPVQNDEPERKEPGAEKNGGAELILLGVSVLVLLGGILFAVKIKH